MLSRVGIRPDLGLRANDTWLTMGSHLNNDFKFQFKPERLKKGVLSMTYIPTQSGFMNLEDSEKLLRAIFPNYPTLEPCHRPPSLEPIPQGRADRSN